jgi:hypothetical protein
VPLLVEPGYRRFLAETHPELEIRDDRLSSPSFVACLDIREPMLPGAARDLLTAFTEIGPRYVRPRSLFLGTPFERYDQTHLLDEIDAPVRLAQAAGAEARRENLEMVVLTNVCPEHPMMPRWLDAGFVTLPSFPDTLVDLDVPDFSQYLLRLPQGDRSGVRRNIRRFDRAGHRLETITDSSALGPTLYEAYRPLLERATVRWQPHTEAYFCRLTEMGRDVRLTVARDPAGQIAGFIVNFVDGEGFQAGRVGVAPGYDRKDAVYFRLMYHAVEESLAHAKSPQACLSLEPTGYRMKRHLGARSRRLVNLVFGVSLKWRSLLGGFAPLGRWFLSHLDDREALERAY